MVHKMQCHEVAGYGEKVELLPVTRPAVAGAILIKTARKVSLPEL